MDKENISALTMLVLPSAFDTVDHNTVMDVLNKRFAVTDSALAWFKSYLVGRTWTVTVKSTRSVLVQADWRVPQDSVLGPKSFTSYNEEVSEVLEKHGLLHHAFADDIQAHMNTSRAEARKVSPRIERCLTEVLDFCGSRLLQLNPAKSELLCLCISGGLETLSAADKTILE